MSKLNSQAGVLFTGEDLPLFFSYPDLQVTDKGHLHQGGQPALFSLLIHMIILVAQMVKKTLAMWDTWVRSLGQEDPLEEGMATHSSILAGESHGQRSLSDYSPQRHKELDMTE